MENKVPWSEIKCSYSSYVKVKAIAIGENYDWQNDAITLWQIG